MARDIREWILNARNSSYGIQLQNRESWLRKSLVQVPAESRANTEHRLGCSQLNPVSFVNFQGWRSCNLFHQTVTFLVASSWNYFTYISSDSSPLDLMIIVCYSSTMLTSAVLRTVWSHERQWKAATRSSLSFFFSRLNKPSLISLSLLGRCFRPQPSWLLSSGITQVPTEEE